MFDLKDNSLIITSSNIKKQMLLNNNKLLNIKILTKKEFVDNYFGTYKVDAIYHLLKSQGCSYEVAKLYLDNLFYNYEVLKDQYNDLESSNLLIFNKYFKDELNNYDNIYVINLYLDKYIKDVLDNYNTIYINNDVTLNKQVDVYEFDDQTSELNYILIDIINNHISNLNDVYLVNVESNYIDELKRLSKLYNIRINFNDNNYIYSSINIKEFINDLKEYKDINKSLDIIKDINIKNKIIDIINKYNIDVIDDIYIDIIINEIKKIKYDNKVYDNAINIIDIDDIYLKDKYYYILNFNQGILPKVYHDDDFISDKNKEILGINTSLDNYLISKNNIINIINNYNITITYKLKDNKNTYLASPMIGELNLNVIKNMNNNNYKYSNNINRLELSTMLDNYYKYNILDESINDLASTYKIDDYNSYDNSLNNIDYNLLKKHTNNKLLLSYSSLNSFKNCPFKYYIRYILKLDKYENNFNAIIGNLFHSVLSKMYDKDFDIKKSYDEYINTLELSNKELFFTNKLFDNIKRIIDVIKMHDRHSNFDKELLEQEYNVDKSDDINIIFNGKIDKIKYLEKEGITYVSIIDYKTGSDKLNLNNINYGLNMQLPIYIYLIKKNINNVKVCGFYLQKLLKNTSIDSEDLKKEEEDNLKLLGYTIDDEELIKEFDNTYEDSSIISGLKKKKDGSFYSSSKLINEEQIEKLVSIVDEEINDMINKIKLGAFKIQPKNFEKNKINGCENCKFIDLCFRKPQDVLELDTKTLKDIIGGEE